MSYLQGHPPGLVPASNDCYKKYLDCNIMKDLELELPRSASPEFLTNKNCEVIKVYCFKAVTIGIIGYLVIDNQ
jgi:hypothetical protein